MTVKLLGIEFRENLSEQVLEPVKANGPFGNLVLQQFDGQWRMRYSYATGYLPSYLDTGHYPEEVLAYQAWHLGIRGVLQHIPPSDIIEERGIRWTKFGRNWYPVTTGPLFWPCLVGPDPNGDYLCWQPVSATDLRRPPYTWGYSITYAFSPQRLVELFFAGLDQSLRTSLQNTGLDLAKVAESYRAHSRLASEIGAK